MALKLICQEIWFARDRGILFAERGIIGSQRPGDFLLASFFVGIEKKVWQHTIECLTQSLITTNPQVNQQLTCWHNYNEEKEGKGGKTTIAVGTSVTV